MCSQNAEEFGSWTRGKKRFVSEITVSHVLLLVLQSEVAYMVIECCSQERSYLRFYGLLGQVRPFL